MKFTFNFITSKYINIDNNIPKYITDNDVNEVNMKIKSKTLW